MNAPGISVKGFTLNADNMMVSKSDEMVTHLYKKAFSGIKHYILHNSGRIEDAEDIFQDALVILLRKMEDEHFRLTCSIETFIFSVCRFLWYHKLDKQRRFSVFCQPESKNCDNSDEDSESSDFHDELLRLLRLNFARLDEKSKQTLTFYMNHTPNKETTQLMGYKHRGYAKARKYLCKEKLKALIFNDPDYKKLQVELN